MTLALQGKWQNHRAEATADISCLLAECFLGDRAAWPRYACGPRAEAVGHGVLSGTARRPLTMLTPRAAVPGERQVSRAHDVPKLCGPIVLLLSFARREPPTARLTSCRRLTEQTKRRGDSASPHNGSDAKLHGQGPRAEAGAARGAPACEARECAPRDTVRF